MISESANNERFIQALSEAQPGLRAYCFAAVGNPNDGMDVLQKTCLVLWKKRDHWDPQTPFKNWAIQVARYEVLGHVRDRARERLIFDDDTVSATREELEEPSATRSEQLEVLQESLTALKPLHRETLLDRYAKGLNIREIARKQGRKLGAVKALLMRARRFLAGVIRRRVTASADAAR